LAIILGMIGGVEMQLGSLEPEKLLPKITGESWITIKDNRKMHAMKLEYIILTNSSHCVSGEWVLKSTKMNIFGKMIYYHHDY